EKKFGPKHFSIRHVSILTLIVNHSKLLPLRSSNFLYLWRINYSSLITRLMFASINYQIVFK
ncbi:hypothetical protein GIB67_040018, partial [Kingdonia uniflora]